MLLQRLRVNEKTWLTTNILNPLCARNGLFYISLNMKLLNLYILYSKTDTGELQDLMAETIF